MYVYLHFKTTTSFGLSLPKGST